MSDGEKEQVDIPFYAWQCISICLKNENQINLIIKDE